jgi:hypothetical protein
MRYRINTPTIIYEVLDGEVVILNLEEGIYYSLNETGREIWSLVSRHYTLKEIGAVFDEKIFSEIEMFIQQLVDHKLVIITDRSPEEALQSVVKKESLPPKLNVYEDMKELLLLDPIHEVDLVGWPVAP